MTRALSGGTANLPQVDAAAPYREWPRNTRDAIASAGRAPYVFAPCLHARPCPLLERERDWCHDRIEKRLPEKLARFATLVGLQIGFGTFGTLLADRQAVQFMLADCASELYIGRLMLLHIAYKAEKGLDIRQENSIAKIFHAHMVHKVIDTAIQLHGALGFSQDTPLAKWYTQVRSQRLVDGPDEVHKWKIGKNVIKAFREHGTTASAAGGDLL